MIKYSDIRKGARAILLGVTNVNLPTSRSWENRDFKPIIGIPWLRETLIPGEERVVASDTLQGIGILQYDLFWPVGDGTEIVEDLADDIKDEFKPVTSIGIHNSIWRSERSNAIIDEKWYMVPIKLTYRSFSIG